MARKLRVQYPGAIYHVMSRGDRREAIFQGDDDRKLFLKTLGEACAKTDWQVHAWCLMRNHFHLVVETPRGNLVAGMKWLLGTYTMRYNLRHKEFGHLFSGRYKALIVDGSGNGYLKTVCDYVHLNPARSKMLGPDHPLKTFAWSSYPLYLVSTTERPSWLRVDRLLGEWGIPKDSPAGRRAFSERLEGRRKEELKDEFRSVERGWCLGTEEFRQELLEQVGQQARPTHAGPDVRESDATKAERITLEALHQLGWTEADLATRRKGDPAKIMLATKLRQETTMTLAWIAQRLKMGVPAHLAHLLWRSRKS
jgi:REP element-mobilizing transposase RayT